MAVAAGLVLAAGTLAASRVFTRAEVRYRLLAVAFVLVAAIGPVALVAAVLRPASGGGLAGLAGAADTVKLDVLALPVFALAAAVAAALLVQLLFDVVRLRRIKHAAEPLGEVAIRGARIGKSGTVSTPTAIGYLHPAVIVPSDFRARVDDGEWNAVIAHECAHLARRDDWAKAVQSAVLRACWWLPGLWLLARALDLERELASDERAAGETGPHRYAACLLRLATDRSGHNLAPALWNRRTQVAIRVERLLRPATDATPVVRATALGALSAAALASLAFAVLAIPPAGRAGPHHAKLLQLAASPAQAGALASAVRLSLRNARPGRFAGSDLTPPDATQSAARTSTPPADPATATSPVANTSISPVAERAAPGGVHHAPTRPARRHATEVALVPLPVPGRIFSAEPGQAVAKPALAERVPTTEGALSPPAFLALARPHIQCPTCFGPLRSPDSANPGVPAAAPRFDPPAAIAAIVDDDATGATELRNRIFLIRIPRVSAP
ncbi:MAG: M56 family metallopeptidase [Candidatus Elarobacter sp.]